MNSVITSRGNCIWRKTNSKTARHLLVVSFTHHLTLCLFSHQHQCYWFFAKFTPFSNQATFTTARTFLFWLQSIDRNVKECYCSSVCSENYCKTMFADSYWVLVMIITNLVLYSKATDRKKTVKISDKNWGTLSGILQTDTKVLGSWQNALFQFRRAQSYWIHNWCSMSN